MNCRAKAVLILLFTVGMVACAQSPKGQQSPAQQTQARGYWVDPSTGLMWTAKDNGQNITWRQAVKYCRKLRVAGHSDWRLPTIDELQGVYDGSGFNVPPLHKGDVPVLAGKAKGDLLLTGTFEWSSSRVFIDRRRTGYAWQFEFPNGRRWHEQLGYNVGKRALCVRRAGE